jgi:hypothetical protein
MSVLAQATGRQDVLLRRGVTETWGVRWEQSEDGSTFTPVDLSAWTGVVELRSMSNDVWLSKPVIGDSSGLAAATITPADTAAPEWVGRPSGTWLINMTAPDGRVERLGDGYFYLEA